MSPHQVFLVAALGGIAGAVGLALFVSLALAIYAAVARILDALEDRKTRRRVRRAFPAAYKAIDALPTTNHPTEDAP